jgi:RHS repeat-associated protein
MSPDGSIYYFGHKDAHTTGCTNISASYAPVTRIEDSLGNQMEFFYEPGALNECRLKEIVWGENYRSGLNGAFADMRFQYGNPSECNAGAQTSYRTGSAIVTGASELTTIVVSAMPSSSWAPPQIAPVPTQPAEYTRTISLGYSSSTSDCSTKNHTPYRALTSIGERAVNAETSEVVMPQIDFTYGSEVPNYQASSQVPIPWTSAASGAQGNPWPNNYNLGWGKRPRADWPTVEAMMLDIDGDGLIDRVQSEPATDPVTGATNFCRARWYRNYGPAFAGGAQFQLAGDINMPTLKWATPNNGSPYYTGGTYAKSLNIDNGVTERCALNYQSTGYYNSELIANKAAACPNSNAPSCQQVDSNGIGVCPTTSSDCSATTFKSSSDFTHFAWRWMDVDGDQLPDLVGSPATGGIASYDLRQGNLIFPSPAPLEPLIFGTFPQCPSTSFTGGNWNSDQYTMCHGMFPWFVYKNHGNGKFGKDRASGSGTTNATWGPEPDQILYQPSPLESSNGDSSITSNPVGQYDGVVDIDGDGFPDGIHRAAGSPTAWNVFRNDGTGQLEQAGAGLSYLFQTSIPLFLGDSQFQVPPGDGINGSEGMDDINGDGLVDHWSIVSSSPTKASAQWNDGRQFLTASAPARDRMATDDNPIILTYNTSTHTVCDGMRDDIRRAVDLDADGRDDIMSVIPNTVDIAPQFNSGGVFTQQGTIPWNPGGAFHLTRVRTDDDNDPCHAPNSWWEILGDLIDLDGDGLKEDLAFTYAVGGPATALNVSQWTYTSPPRLLSSINNNRGAVTTIAYSSMNGPAVTETASLGKATPTTNWVAKSVTTTDSAASPTTSDTTSYFYKNPQWSRDPDWPGPRQVCVPTAPLTSAAAFRGFEEVQTTSQSGAVTIERFTYHVPSDPCDANNDWSGRLTSKVVKPNSGSIVNSIDTTSWARFDLFDGLVKAYLPVAADHWTCSNGWSEAVCAANFTDKRRHIETAYSSIASTSTADSTPLLWAATESRRQANTGTQNAGDRNTTTGYNLYSDANSYRLKQSSSTDAQWVGGSWQMYAKTASTWDSTTGNEITTERWVDGNSIDRLITTNSYNDIGNLISRQDPRGQSETYEYDGRGLFVSAVNNAWYLHWYEYEYEYGTGIKRITRGPGVAYCSTYIPAYCPPGVVLRPEDRLRIDGFGRTIEHWTPQSKDANLGDYQQKLTEMYSYVDSTTPNSVTHQTAIDETGGMMRYRSETMSLDGHGRPRTTSVATAGAANAVTTYKYSNDGTLSSVSVPDPSVNTSSVVAYTYVFDTLGRPTAIRRPDSVNVQAQSGVDIAYDGLTTTTTEVVGAAGGQIGETQTTNDRYGRLLLVKEKTATSTYATTTYSYAPDDNVASIVDPQSVTTQLVHDFAGRRTSITRSGRTWSYGYDGNGNLISETSPIPTTCSPAPACQAAYTTTTAYDPLNRVQSKMIAPRDLSAADRDLFAADSELYVWDYGSYARGQLSQWYAYAPGDTTQRVVTMSNYDGHGNVVQDGGRFQSAGFGSPFLARDILSSYQPSGLLSFSQFRELDGQFPAKSVEYDERGLPSKISVSFDRGVTWPNAPTVQTRNVAGLVTKRRTDVTGSPMTFVESNWTYDSIGRVKDQTVGKSGTGRVAEQTLAYYGNDDVKDLNNCLGAKCQEFGYNFDLRHQLTTVLSKTAGYFAATYHYGDSGRFAQAKQTRTVIPAPPNADSRLIRDVTYLYEGGDPEEVTGLKNFSDGSYLATYVYDAAGNQLTRTYPATGESYEYTYDGKDQLRRVVRKIAGVVKASEEYWYDNAGNRTQVLRRDASGQKIELIWFIGDVEAHYDSTGTVTKTYSYISEGTPIARVQRLGPAATDDSLEYQFHGLANNTIAAIASDGTINTSISYAPFGEVLEATDSGSSQGLATHKRRSNDKYEDDISALAYYGARYYDKTLIGWTQGDPLYRFAPDTAWARPRNGNLYVFSLNNALRYIDPDGRKSFGEVMEAVANIVWQVASVPLKADEVVLQVVFVPTDQSKGNEQHSLREALHSLNLPLTSPSAPVLPGPGTEMVDVETGGGAGQGKTSEGGNSGTGQRPQYAPKGADGKPLELPRGKDGELAPSSSDPHTQIGTTKGRKGDYVQTREFGADGKPVKQTDWTDHGRPTEHTDPHVHDYEPNPTGGTPKHGKGRPPHEDE